MFLKEQMQDLLRSRLRELEDPKDRKFMREVFEKVFMPMVDYHDEMMHNLHDQVFYEIKIPGENMCIYTTVCDRSKVEPMHDFMYPMERNDVMNNVITGADMAEKIAAGEKTLRLTTVFMQC